MGANDARRCRVCLCSDFEPCAEGCAWVGDEDLCTACADSEGGLELAPDAGEGFRFDAARGLYLPGGL